MDSVQNRTVYNIVVFVTWTVTSFLCHQFGKTFLTASLDSTPADVHNVASDALLLRQVLLALLLTGIQLGFCVLFVSLENAETASTSGPRNAKLCHALATLATNISMSFMASSSTFAIKMMEPVTSAIVQYLLVGSLLSALSVASLPFIVGGAVIFAGNPMATLGAAPGILSALASNIILAFRNVEMKKMTNKSNSTPLKSRFRNRQMHLPLSVIMMCLSVSLFLENMDVLPDNSTQILLYASLSGLFHVGYSFVSTALVLSQISVVSHAVANIMKRLLVVLLLYMFGQRVATTWNFTGLLVCTVGLLVYAWDKTQSQEGTHIEGDSRPRSGKIYGLIVTTMVGLILVSSSTIGRMDSALRLSLHGSQRALFEMRMPSSNISNDELKTFEANGFRKPHYTQLALKSDELPKAMSREVLDFLKLPLQENVASVNFLSEKLPTSNGVIKEARRIHFNVIGKEMEHFKYAFMLDIAAFENKGDPAITVGEIYFLARMNIEVKYYCSAGRCTKDTLLKAKELAQNYTADELVILVHGGGNIIGYATADLVRFDVLKIFSSYKILVFPQSIWVRSWGSPHVNRTARNYCCHPNLTIVLRDSLSYSIAKRLYNGSTRLLMAPDMAFQIGHVPRFMSPVYDILWIKRKDGETPNYQPPKKVPDDLRVHVSDWWKWLTPTAITRLEKAFNIATNGLFFLQRGRVVITDRLHGHILSVLMDIPHVLIDNKAKKLSAYHNTWTRSLSNTVITDDPSKALDLAIELLRKYNNTLPPIVPYLNVREDFSQAAIGVPDTAFP